MKRIGLAMVLMASLTTAQEPSEFRPAETNV